jgi:hypothetical protein
MTNPADTRLASLTQWVSSQPDLHADVNTIAPASSDASFRRYFRLNSGLEAHPSLILMDAPPPQEDVRPFVAIAHLLAQAGVSVPQILAKDEAAGFLALSDLGNTTYLSVLSEGNARGLYTSAYEALLKIQLGTKADTPLPPYDQTRLVAEMQLFPDWYAAQHCGKSLLDDEKNALAKIFELLAKDAMAQAQVIVHRDYHSRNLMVIETGSAAAVRREPTPGILDFQDAVIGPVTYDLVSLFRDAYIEWTDEQVLDWSIRYWEAAKKAGVPVHSDPSEFFRQFEWMGLQRHLKVLGIFARLYHRDGKDGYLKDLPLVMRYTRKVAERFSVFKPLVKILDRLVDVQPMTAYTF